MARQRSKAGTKGKGKGKSAKAASGGLMGFLARLLPGGKGKTKPAKGKKRKAAEADITGADAGWSDDEPSLAAEAGWDSGDSSWGSDSSWGDGGDAWAAGATAESQEGVAASEWADAGPTGQDWLSGAPAEPQADAPAADDGWGASSSWEQAPDSAPQMAMPPAAQQAQPAPEAAAVDSDKLFPEGVDASLDSLFDSFEPQPARPVQAAPPAAAPATEQQQVVPVAPSETPASSPAADLMGEFMGMLPGAADTPPVAAEAPVVEGWQPQESAPDQGWATPTDDAASGWQPAAEAGWQAPAEGGDGGWQPPADGGWQAPAEAGEAGWQAPAEGGDGGWQPPADGGWQAPAEGGDAGWQPPADGGWQAPAEGGDVGWQPPADGGWQAPAEGGDAGWQPPADGGWQPPAEVGDAGWQSPADGGWQPPAEVGDAGWQPPVDAAPAFVPPLEAVVPEAPPSPAPPAPPEPPAAPPGVPAPPPGVPEAPRPDGLVSVGKMLVDQNQLKKIIDRGEGGDGRTRLITTARGEELDQMLQRIQAVRGASGALIVGRDGLVISAQLSTDHDREMLGAIASSMFANLEVQVRKMQVGKLGWAMMDCSEGSLMIVGLEIGVLVVLAEGVAELDIGGVWEVISARDN